MKAKSLVTEARQSHTSLYTMLLVIRNLIPALNEKRSQKTVALFSLPQSTPWPQVKLLPHVKYTILSKAFYEACPLIALV